MTGASVDESASSNDYLGIFEDTNNDSAGFTDNDVVFGPTPRAGTLRNLRAAVESAQSTSTRQWTITIHSGTTAPGSATAVTCNIGGTTATTCDSGALNQAVAAGSYVTVRVTSTGTSAASARKWRFSFEY